MTTEQLGLDALAATPGADLRDRAIHELTERLLDEVEPDPAKRTPDLLAQAREAAIDVCDRVVESEGLRFLVGGTPGGARPRGVLSAQATVLPFRPRR